MKLFTTLFTFITIDIECFHKTFEMVNTLDYLTNVEYLSDLLPKEVVLNLGMLRPHLLAFHVL